MTDNARKFLVFVSKSYTLRHAMKDAKDPEAMLKLAKDNGFDLTAEDFESSEMEEMSEDEMRAVAGGSAMTCITMGNVNEHDLVCYCSSGAGNGAVPDPAGGGGCTCKSLGLGFCL